MDGFCDNGRRRIPYRLIACRWRSPAIATLIVFSAGILVACVVAARPTFGWAGYHVLMAGAVIASGVNLAAGAWIGRSRRGWAEPVAAADPVRSLPRPLPRWNCNTRGMMKLAGQKPRQSMSPGSYSSPAVLRWTGIANAMAVLLSIRAMGGDPQRPWWSAGITATIALLWAALACWLAAPRLLYAGGLLLNLATTFWFIARVAPASASPMLDLSLVNIAVLSVSGLAALVLHLNIFREGMQPPTRAARLPFHRFAAVVSLMGLIAIVCVTVTSDVAHQAFSTSALMTWGAIVPSLAIALAMLWDPDMPYVVAEIYAIGFIALAAGLHEAVYFHRPIAVAGAVAISGYVLLTGFLYAGRATLCEIVSNFGTPKLRRDETAGWLRRRASFSSQRASPWPFDVTLPWGSWRFACSRHLHFRRDPGIAFDFARRPAAGSALRDPWPASHCRHGVGMGVDVARIGRLAPSHGGASGGAGLVAGRLRMDRIGLQENSSGRRRLGARFARWPLAWAVVMVAVLVIESPSHFRVDRCLWPVGASAIVMGNLIVAAAACVLFALVPARDPLKLSAKRRGSYVYLAEACSALAGAPATHRALVIWRRVVAVLAAAGDGLAFGGVALAEVFRRRGTIALSSPLFEPGRFCRCCR